MLLHMDIAKLDRDVAYVAHVCCKLLFPMFDLFFHMYVASVFIWMLHMFHTYDARVLSGCCIRLHWFQVFLGVFASVSNACFKCFIFLQTYVACVASECLKSRSIIAHVAM